LATTERAVGPSGTRERLLGAARSVFAGKGYQAATTREIAARAGVAELTLFRHFTSKQGLFEALLEQVQPLHALEELMVRPGERPPVEELTAIGRRLVEFAAQNGELMRLLLWEARAQPELAARAAQFLPRVRAWLARYLEDAAALHGWPARHWYTCAQAYLGMIFSYAMTCMLLPDPRLAPPEEAVPLFVRIFVAGLSETDRSPQRAERVDRGA
jgi:AcrR family transcriptional regulator